MAQNKVANINPNILYFKCNCSKYSSQNTEVSKLNLKFWKYPNVCYLQKAQIEHTITKISKAS